MSRVTFHTGVADPVDYTCKLLRKGHRQGLRMRVEAPMDDLERLDLALWVFDPQDFVPHVLLRVGEQVPERLHRTLLWLVDPAAGPSAEPVAAQILVRWSLAEAVDPQAWERVIEIVSHDPSDRQTARQRWRLYESAGAELQHHTA
jgi:DNA polymerase-3 subunit chi